jgi:hypothetical protein
VDMKFSSRQSGAGRAVGIRVGRIASSAVYPGVQAVSGQRVGPALSAVTQLASSIIREQRGSELSSTEKDQLDRFTLGLRQRVAELGRQSGVPDVLDRLRF